MTIRSSNNISGGDRTGSLVGPSSAVSSLDAAAILAPELDELRATVWRHLFGLPDLHSSIPRVTAPEVLRSLLADFAGQVAAELVPVVVEHFHHLSSSEPNGDSESLERKALTMGTALYIERLEQFADFIRAAEGKPILTVFGSARDSVMQAPTLEFLAHLAERSITDGISVGNGGSEGGAMGATTRAWLQAIDAAEGVGQEVTSEVFLVLLGIRSSREAPFMKEGDHPHVHVSPALANFNSRTPTLYASGPSRASVVLDGGMGSLEELTRKNGEGARHGTIHSFLRGDEIPSTFVVGYDGYYDELQRQFHEMVQTGAAGIDAFQHIHFRDLRNADTPDQRRALSDEIIESLRLPSIPVFDPKSDVVVAQRTIVEAINRELDGDARFYAPVFPYDAPGNILSLDKQYQEQVRIEAERMALKAYLGGEGLKTAVDLAVQQAIEWRPQLKHFYETCASEKTITIVGSDLPHVWNDELESFADSFVERAVRDGYSLVISGDRRRGVAHQISRRWAEAKASFPASESKLIRVQLHIDEERIGKLKVLSNGNNEASPEGDAYYEVLGPPLHSLIMRSACRLALGNQAGVVIFPAGPRELDEVASVSLAAQLAGLVHTPFSPSSIDEDVLPPEIYFLNAHLNGGSGPFWDGWSAQLRRCVQEGAVDERDINTHHFENPSADLVSEMFGEFEAVLSIRNESRRP